MATTPDMGTTELTTPSDREITMTRVVDAPRELVFACFTDPRHLPHWMTGPEGWEMPVCELDLRVGGKWHFAWRREDGGEMAITGEFREIEPPERIVQTESWGPEWPETLNTLVLTEEDGRTTIAQTMLFPSPEARDAALGTGMKDGASLSYDRLARYLATLGPR